jgi:hypothetical protein
VFLADLTWELRVWPSGTYPRQPWLSVGEVLSKLAATQRVGSSESATFDRALDAYRAVVDQCHLHAPECRAGHALSVANTITLDR